MASFAKDDNNNNEATPLINPEGKIFTNEWSSDCNPVTGSILNKQNLRLATFYYPVKGRKYVGKKSNLTPNWVNHCKHLGASLAMVSISSGSTIPKDRRTLGWFSLSNTASLTISGSGQPPEFSENRS